MIFLIYYFIFLILLIFGCTRSLLLPEGFMYFQRVGLLFTVVCWLLTAEHGF